MKPPIAESDILACSILWADSIADLLSAFMKNKNLFLNMLALGLSFSHSYHDTIEIVENYNEWFEQEKGAGRTEGEIRKSLSILHIIQENYDLGCSTLERCRLLLSSPLFLFIVLLVIRFLVEAFVLNDTWYGWNFGVVVMLANIVFPVLEYFVVRKCGLDSIDDSKQGHTKILMGVCAAFFTGALFLAVLSFYPGYISQGRYCVAYLWASAFLFLIISSYISLYSILNLRRILPIIIFLQGITSLIFFMISRFHILGADRVQFQIYFMISVIEISAVVAILWFRCFARNKYLLINK